MPVGKWLRRQLESAVAAGLDSPTHRARFRKNWATADDPRWKEHFDYFSESPAETAFLMAMIDELKLEPKGGQLFGSGVQLDLQVEIQGYRADFLANDQLVIEIDGAAYHSSEEAIERDQRRDAEMQSWGYQVLRIPAREVFYHPKSAVVKVQKRLRRCGATLVEPQDQEPEKPRTVTSVLRSFRRAVDRLDQIVTAAGATEEALAPLREKLKAEKLLIEMALEEAQSEKRVADFRGQSEEHAALFDASFHDFEEVFAEELGKVDYGADELYAAAREPIEPPKATGNVEIDEAIRNGFEVLLAERHKLLHSTRALLTSETDLQATFRLALERAGNLRCWHEIMSSS